MLVTIDIGINLFYAYYTQAKKYHPGLKLGIDEGKVVGIELRKIIIHLKLLHQSIRKNPRLLHHHHYHITDYLLLYKNQQITTPIKTILTMMF